MPEGDTIFRAATTLRRALEGARVAKFVSSKVRARLEGQRLEQITAAGKNLLMKFENGRTLRTHMRMHGSWHVYREGERWQRPAFQAVVELHMDNGFVAVCFAAPVVELVSSVDLHLGPDATTDAFDTDAALARIDRTRPVCEVLLDQRALAGVGNVIKSEALFICREDPFVPAGDAKDLRKLVEVCHDLLVRNRVSGPRVTRTFGKHWVYGRSGKPCFECGTLIRMRRVGFGARSTYYCPNCQLSR